MRITRRDFMRWAATSTAALGAAELTTLGEALAAATSPPVIWLQGAACTGCTVSLMNVTEPATIDDVLMDTISLKYHPNLTAAAGELAVGSLVDAANSLAGQFILCIEGGIPAGAGGKCCVIGHRDGADWTMLSAVNELGPKARHVVAVGSCAAHGGVVRPDPYAAVQTVGQVLAGKTRNRIVNLPACPAHPTAIVGTLATLITNPAALALNASGNPTAYFGRKIHDACPRKGTGEAGELGRSSGCFKSVGCRGPSTVINCPSMRWNGGKGWCIGANAACIGCAAPDFPRSPLLRY
jgi:hydrogenase small subunit